MNLIGEYPVSVDNKGRLRVPTGLLRQLGDKPDDGQGVEFVVNKGIEKCLNLYPKAVWETVTAEMSSLNQFNEKHRMFVRRFFAGAYPIETDSADRLLLQKPQMDYAGITTEAVLVAMTDRIEIWSPEEYDAYLLRASELYSDLANEVMGGAGKAKGGENSNTILP